MTDEKLAAAVAYFSRVQKDYLRLIEDTLKRTPGQNVDSFLEHTQHLAVLLDRARANG